MNPQSITPPTADRFAPMARPTPAAVAPTTPRPVVSDREDDIRRMAELLRRVDLTPSPGFAAEMRAAQSQEEVDDLVSDQIQRVINVFRAEMRAERAQGNDADSRGD